MGSAVYAQLAHAKKDIQRMADALHDATDELRASTEALATRDAVITDLRIQNRKLKGDNRNMQQALSAMAAADPALYEQVATKFNLM